MPKFFPFKHFKTVLLFSLYTSLLKFLKTLHIAIPTIFIPGALHNSYVLFLHNNVCKALRYKSHCNCVCVIHSCGQSNNDRVRSKHVAEIRNNTVLCFDKIYSASLIIYENNEEGLSKKDVCQLDKMDGNIWDICTKRE
jgi:hypothetical protein